MLVMMMQTIETDEQMMVVEIAVVVADVFFLHLSKRVERKLSPQWKEEEAGRRA
jgi:hypothetical protein